MLGLFTTPFLASNLSAAAVELYLSLLLSGDPGIQCIQFIFWVNVLSSRSQISYVSINFWIFLINFEPKGLNRKFIRFKSLLLDSNFLVIVRLAVQVCPLMWTPTVSPLPHELNVWYVAATKVAYNSDTEAWSIVSCSKNEYSSVIISTTVCINSCCFRLCIVPDI